MADDTDLNPTEAPSADGVDAESGVSELDAFHLHGKGNDALEDAQEQDMSDGRDSGDDLMNNANIQTGRRDTFESILAAGVPVGGATSSASDIIQDTYTPSRTDSGVKSNFEAPPVAFTAAPTAENTTTPTEETAGAPEVLTVETPATTPQNTPQAAAEEPTAAPAIAAAAADIPADISTDSTTPTEQVTEQPQDNEIVAQAPELTLTTSSGFEDLALKLNIVAGLNDTDGGNETLTVVIGNVPDGFTFTDSHGNPIGTLEDDGAWHFTADEISDLYIIRPEHYSGDLSLTVTATSTESNGSTSTVSGTLPVHVEAIADAPTLSASDTAGTENTWIPLSVQTGLVDADGSESISVYITGVPDGALLNHGTQLSADLTLEDGTVFHAGTWVLSPSDLNDLQVKPPINASADFQLQVYSATTESQNGDVAVSGPAVINVDVGIVAPSIDGTASGAEDSWTPLTLSASVNEADGNETLTVTLSNLSDGAILRQASTGQLLTPNADGSYTITGMLDDLEVRWDENTHLHSDNDIEFDLTATVTDTDVGTATETARDTNSSTTHVVVDLVGVADEMKLSASATGNEDTHIALDLQIQLTDTDGSESLTGNVSITFGPEDVAAGKLYLNGQELHGTANADGTTTYQVSSSLFALGANNTYHLSGSNTLTFLPGENLDTDVQYTFSATSLDHDGSTKISSGDGTIDVVAVADNLTITSTASGNEDSVITLNPTIQLTDIDGSESLTGTVDIVFGPEDVAAGKLYFNGQELQGTLDPATGNTTYHLPVGDFTLDPTTHTYSLSSGNSLTFEPGANLDTDVSYQLSATVLDNDGSTKTTEATGTIEVIAVADDVVITSTARGDEDSVITLNPTIQLTDTDGSESLTGTVDIVFGPEDVAAGKLYFNGQELQGTLDPATGNTTYHLPAGDFTLDPATNTYSLSSGNSLTFEPGENLDTDVSYGLSATVLDGDGSTQTTHGSGSIIVDAVADSLNITSTASGTEDSVITLNPTIQLTDIDGSESLTGTVDIVFGPEDVAAGKLYFNGTELQGTLDPATGNTTYHLPVGDFTLDPTTHTYSLSSGNSLTFEPGANLDTDVSYQLSATVLDNDGSTKTTEATGTIEVIAVADDVVITSTARGDEDSVITLNPTIQLTDTDGSESLTGTVDIVFGPEDVAAGKLYFNGQELQGTLDPATGNTTYHLPAGDFTLDPATNTYSLSSGNSLTFEPGENLDTDVSYGLSATVLDGDGSTQTTHGSGSIIVDAVADSLNITSTASGTEDSVITLNPTIQLTDIDGSESLTGTVDIVFGPEDVAAGKLYFNGTELQGTLDPATGNTTYHLPVGDFTLDPTTHTYSLSSGNSLTFEPGANLDTDVSYQLSATVLDNDGSTKTTEATGTIEVIAVADDVVITSTARGDEDSVITLNPTIQLTDTDGSESLTGTVDIVFGPEDVAAGKLYFNGQELQGTLDPATGNTTYHLPAGDFTLDPATNTYSLSSGNSLTFAPGENLDTDVSYGLSATVLDGDGSTQTTNGTGSIIVDAVADAVTVTAGPAAGMEDTAIALNLTSAGLADTDGSETMTVYISGIPDGAVLAQNGATMTEFSGSVTLENGTTITSSPNNHVYAITITAGMSAADALAGLTVTPPENSSKDFGLTLTAVTEESENGDQAITTSNLWVDVGTHGVDTNAMGINLVEQTVGAGNNWNYVNLDPLTDTLTHADGTETVKVYLTGIPDDATFQVKDGDGNWVTVSPNSQGQYIVDDSQLSDVRIMTGANNDADFTISARALVMDQDVGTEHETASTDTVAPDSVWSEASSITVTVNAVADQANISADASGYEDSTINITPTIQLTDPDGSENLIGTVDIVFGPEDVAAGTLFVNGQELHGTLDPDTGNTTFKLDLALFEKDDSTQTYSLAAGNTLTFEPGHNLDTDVHYDMVVTVEDNGGVTSTTTTAGTIEVIAVADDLLISSTARGDEDTAITLDPAIQLTDIDGSESLTGSVTITFGPEDVAAGKLYFNGQELHGTSNADGTTTFSIPSSAFALDAATNTYHLSSSNSLTFEPGHNLDTDVTYDLSATVLDGDNSTKTSYGVGTITVDAVADNVVITSTARGDEDSVITLSPTIQLTDIDGSESLTGTVNIVFGPEDVAAGKLYFNGQELQGIVGSDGNTTFTLSAGDFTLNPTTHTYSLSSGNSLTFEPGENLDTDVSYKLSATVLDNDGSTQLTEGVGIIVVDAVADATTISGQNAAGMEDTAIALNLSTGGLVDTDGSETLTIYIAGVPNGAVLAQNGVALSELSGSVHLENGTVLASSSNSHVYAITITAGMSAADALAGLTVTPAAGSSKDFGLTLTAVTQESENGDQAISTGSLWVDVGTHGVTVNDMNVEINERTVGAGTSWNTLDLSAVTDALPHADGTEKVQVYLTGIPSDATFQVKNGSSWVTVTPNAQGEYVVNDSQLSNVRIMTGYNNDTDFVISAKALVTDQDVGTAHEDAAGTATPDSVWSDVASINVTVNAVADSANASGSGVGVEDQWIGLNLKTSLRDTDGSESITKVTLSGVPEGAKISLDGVVLTPSSSSGSGASKTYTYDLTSLDSAELKRVQVMAPEDSNKDYTLKLNTTIVDVGTDGDVAAGKGTKVTTTNVSLTVYGDADTPTVVVDESSKTISEDTLYKLSNVVTDPALTDTDGSETLTLRIAPQNEDHSVLAIDVNHDGVISQTEYIPLPADGYWTISADQLPYTYVGGEGNWSGANASDVLRFDITAVATEDDAAISTPGLVRSGEATSQTYTVTLEVDPVADALVISAHNEGVEDQVGGIAVTPTIQLIDTDGSEQLVDTVYILTSDGDMLHGTLELNGQTLTAQLVTGYDADGNPTFGGADAADVPSVYAYSIDAGDFSRDDSTYSISGLVFTPVGNSDADVTYKIAATVSDGAETLVTIADGSIIIDAVADAPNVSLAATQVATEDTPLVLGITASVSDGDGSEVLSAAQVLDVPEGWTVGYWDGHTFTAAVNDGDGAWTVDPSRLSEVSVLPPQDLSLSASEAVNFRLSVTSSETAANNADVALRSAETIKSFSVSITADADGPSLVVNNARVVEDHDVKLDIMASVTDRDVLEGRDASESLTVYVSGDFEGGSLVDSHGNALTWDSSANAYVIPADQLNNVYFRPQADSNTDVTLTVTARSTEASNGDYAERSTTLTIDVKGDADQATYNGQVLTGDPLAINGQEGRDGAVIEINPNFDKFGSTDIDGSETVSLVVSDIAQGVNVYMTPGNEQYLLYIGNGQWAVDADHLGDVRVSLDNTDYSGTLENAFVIKVVVTEDDGDVSQTTQSVNLVIDPTTDTQSISLSGGAAEDAHLANGVQVDIPVNISISPADITDGVESITAVTISVDTDALGLPAGTVLTLTLDGTTYDLTAGDSITLDANSLAAYTDADGKVNLPLTMDGLPENWAKDVPVHISATSQEPGAAALTLEATKMVVITADADQPDSFTASATNDVDNANSVDLGITIDLADKDGSEQVSYYQISGVPEGAILNMGVAAGNGVWIVTAAQYDGGDLHLEGADGLNGTLTVKAMIVDTDPDNPKDSDSTFATTTVDFDIPGGSGGGGTPVTPVIPGVTINTITSPEDHSFTIDADITDGNSSTALVIENMPNGITINGTLGVDYFEVNGTIVIPADKLSTVSFTPAEDFSGDIAMTVKATSTWGLHTVESSSETDIVVHVTPDTDGATLSGSILAGADQTEDSAGVPFTLTISQNDADNSEFLDGSTVTIDGSSLPAGTTLSLNGVVLTPDANGHYTLDISTDFGASASDFHDQGSLTLTGLSVTPPADWHGDLNISFSVSVHDEGVVGGVTQQAASTTFSTPMTITISAETDTALITPADASGNEDTAITLDLSVFDSDLKAAVHDYGSEALSVVIEGVPEGAVLTGASNNGTYELNGVTYTSWTIHSSAIDASTGEITGLSITPPEDWSGTLNLSVSAYTMELSTRTVVMDSQTFTVSVAAVSDTASIDPQNITASAGAREDQEVALTLNAQLADVDGSETLSVKISGVPDGSRFTDGQGNSVGTAMGSGVFVFTAAQIATLHIVGPHDYSGTLELQAQAISTDGSAASAESGWVPFTVTLLGQADAPELTLAHGTIAGTEDQTGGIALDITGALTDTTGETLQLIITGAPEGSTFTATDGTIIHATTSPNGSVSWVVDGDDISGLHLNTPRDWNGTVNLGLELVSSEDGTTASTVDHLTVNVAAVNDAPVVDVLTTSTYDNNYQGPLFVVADQADGSAGLTISDVDNATLSHMDISITNGLHDGDSLSIYGQTVNLGMDGSLSVTVDGSTLHMSYDMSTSTLSFDGEASSGAYATLAGSVVLTSSTGTVEEGTRTISVSTYDNGGLVGSDSTTASIQNGSLDLDHDSRGEILFGGNNSVTLLGSDGADDALVMSFGDPLTTVDGGTAGFDQLYIMPGAENPSASWTITAEMDTHGDMTGNFTVSGSDPSDSFLIHVDPAHVTSVDAHNIAFDQDASGTITFDDHTLEFHELEKITI